MTTIRKVLGGTVSLATLIAASSMNVQAQDKVPAATSPIGEIVVVGSRRGGRTVFNSPVPVDVLTLQQIEQSATLPGEVGEMLQALVPSVNFPRQSNSGPSDHIRALQLRGMNPDQVLVLVNGKRRHPSAVLQLDTKIGLGTAPVDFNTFGTNAIERIEVLRDGAGSQYGSDAIAGVVNIILKDGAQGGQLTGSFGLNATHFDPTGKNITDGETETVSGDAGFSIFNGGFLRVGGEFQNRNATNRGGIGVLPFFENQTPPNFAVDGKRVFAPGDGDSQSFNLFYNAQTPVNANIDLYSFGTYSYRNSEGTAFFRYPDSSTNILSVNPAGFLPVTEGDNMDFSITTGVRGKTDSGWHWDFSAEYGYNKFKFDVKNSLNASLGPTSPTSFHLATYNLGQLVVNADVSREFQVPVIQSANIAFGVEYRHEMFSSGAGDPASFAAGPFTSKDPGAQAGPGLRPQDTVDVNRDVEGAYVDVELDVTNAILLQLSGRYENYDDFGDSLTGKAAVHWEIMPNLALRGSISNSFRAPALSQENFQFGTTSFGPASTLVTSIHLPVNNPIARALGAKKLKEETSTNYSVGFTAQAMDHVSLAVDFFRIDVDDRITRSERFDDPVIEPFILSTFGIPGIESVTFMTNAVNTKTRGVDVVANYDQEIFNGTFNFSAGFNYSKTSIRSIAATPAQLIAIGVTKQIIGLEERNTIESAAPKTKLVLTETWTNDRWSLLARTTRFGEVTRVFDFGGGFVPTQTYGAEWALDFDIEFNVTDQFSVAVGANNALNNYPDLSSADINFFGNLPYDVLSPIGINGGFYYVRTAFRF